MSRVKHRFQPRYTDCLILSLKYMLRRKQIFSVVFQVIHGISDWKILQSCNKSNHQLRNHI